MIKTDIIEVNMDKNERFWIGTTRFTNYTYEENYNESYNFQLKLDNLHH